MTKRVSQLAYTHDEIFNGEIADRIPYHRMYDKEYCVPAYIPFQEHEIRELKHAAERVDRLFEKVLRFTQQCLPDTFLVEQLGLHPALLQAARMEVPYHGISRQDWIRNEQGLRCIENNTDTPTGIPETAYLAGALLERYSSHQSTASSMRTEIQRAFLQLIHYYQAQGLTGRIAFSSYGWHIEDRTNTEYIMQAIQEIDGLRELVSYVPLEQLEIIPDEGLFANGERISILYRLYPLEYLVHDRDESEMEPIGEDLLELVVQHKLGLINPVQSIITQSKGFMALIWSLYERRHVSNDYLGFTLLEQEDIETIEQYMLPTYYEESVFVHNGAPYVAKSYWGREGKGTALYDQRGLMEQGEWGHDEAELQEVRDYYDNQPKIYQERCSMLELELMTEQGLYKGHLLIGAYVIGGAYCGLLPRVGGKITGDMAYYCPAAIIKEFE